MHKICHIEIPTTDKDRSKEFYSKIFGWGFEDFEGYYTFKPPDGVGGGLDDQKKPTVDGVTLYIEVEEIEAKLKDIEAAGGKIQKEKTKISDKFGYYALFLDPSGNSIGLWSKS